ncbi:MAG: hypothetical protein PWR10_1731 [Halanaerobiales bacterium]|nr:hypothetical protein [Halanaerobiales bacterium]
MVNYQWSIFWASVNNFVSAIDEQKSCRSSCQGWKSNEVKVLYH